MKLEEPIKLFMISDRPVRGHEESFTGNRQIPVPGHSAVSRRTGEVPAGRTVSQAQTQSERVQGTLQGLVCETINVY